MPRRARFQISELADLLEQLCYAPPQTLGRDMRAAERLVMEIDPDRNYPADYIVFRITGYRPETIEGTFVGTALLPDLVNLVTELSRRLRLPPDTDGRIALTLEELARRENVSLKTIQRYRRKGLICHYVEFDPNRHKLACFEDAWQRFAAGHRAALRRAASFTRLDQAEVDRIVEDARRLHDSQRLSLNDAAARLAKRNGRAHETIRRILQRHDRRAGDPIFSEPGPLTDRTMRLIERAWRFGIAPHTLAERFGKSRSTIHRSINRCRGDRLRTLELRYIELPTFALPDATDVILSPECVRSGLTDLPPHDDAALLVEALHAAPPADEGEGIDATIEEAMVGACHFLRRRAMHGIEALPDWPSSSALDDIETDLRWVTLLSRRLVAHGLPAALRGIERYLHRPLLEHSASLIVRMLHLAVRVVAGTVATLDPGKGQKLERMSAFAIDRALARMDYEPKHGRAAARHQPGSLVIDDLLDAITPWAIMLELRRDHRAVVDLLEPDDANLITLHRGLGGEAPRSIAQIAATLNRTESAIARRLLEIEQMLRPLAAAGGSRLPAQA